VNLESSDGFLHCLLRVRRGPGEGASAALSGQVERLGTGEKQSFQSWDELQRLVRGWNAAGAGLGPAAGVTPDVSMVEGAALPGNTDVPPR
jgi:hypothetical protein